MVGMRATRRLTMLAAAGLCGSVLAGAVPARAQVDDARQILLRWTEAFNAGKPDDIAVLYAADATLWGTVAPAVIASPAEIRTYFANAAKAGTKVRFVDVSTTEVTPVTVVAVGRYEFERNQAGQPVVLPARYSFVLVKQGEAWKIAHQHSSLAPKAP